MKLLRIIREALIYIVLGTVAIVALSYLIWVTSLAVRCG